MIRTTSGRSAPGNRSAGDAASPPGVSLEALPEVASTRPIDVAELFQDTPGLVLLESARPGRNARWTFLTADPLVVLDMPASGVDPFADARQVVAKLDDAAIDSADAPPFLGGLAGYLAYDLGHSLERLPTLTADDQGLPLLRLALHDWVIAWDRRTGRPGSAGGRSTATAGGSGGASRTSVNGSASRELHEPAPASLSRSRSPSGRASIGVLTRPASRQFGRSSPAAISTKPT